MIRDDYLRIERTVAALCTSNFYDLRYRNGERLSLDSDNGPILINFENGNQVRLSEVFDYSIWPSFVSRHLTEFYESVIVKSDVALVAKWCKLMNQLLAIPKEYCIDHAVSEYTEQYCYLVFGDHAVFVTKGKGFNSIGVRELTAGKLLCERVVCENMLCYVNNDTSGIEEALQFCQQIIDKFLPKYEAKETTKVRGVDALLACYVQRGNTDMAVILEDVLRIVATQYPDMTIDRLLSIYRDDLGWKV